MREQLRDHRAMGEHDDELVDVPGRNAVDGTDDARRERVTRLGAGNHVPSLLGHHLERDRMAFGDVLAEHAAFPLAEVHLAKVGLDDRFDADRVRQRLRGLDRALERRDVDGGDVLAGEALGDPFRLLVADGIERRIAVAVHQREVLADPERSGGAVTDEQQLRRPGRWRERPLRVFGLVFGHGR